MPTIHPETSASDRAELESACESFRALAGATGLGTDLPPTTVRIEDVWTAPPAAIGRSRLAAPVDERSRLRRDTDSITITAASAEGAYRALVRLLIDPPTVGEERADEPRFAWRGFNLDVVRHPFDAATILALIDLLALHGLNVLHLHLTDNQGWRIPVPQSISAGAGPHPLSTEDIANIVAHAQQRCVTVVPEIDLPGHCAYALDAVDGLADPERRAPHPLLSWMDATRLEVAEFIRSAVTELAQHFPGHYLHIGGDEAFGMPHQPYAKALEIAVGAVHDVGRTAIAWQEAIRAEADVDIHQFWMSPADVPSAEALVAAVPPEAAPLARIAAATFAEAVDDPQRLTQRSAEVLLSPQNPIYLDRRYAERSLLETQNDRIAEIGFPGYTPAPSTDVIGWEPLAELPPGTTAAGVEAAIWAETITGSDDLALLLLPRLALFADVAWGIGSATVGKAAARIAAARTGWHHLGFTNDFRSELLDPTTTEAVNNDD